MAQINKPNLHFDSKIYLGSSNAVTVSGLGFQPDWVWVKDRDNGNDHCLVDAVRGVGKYVRANSDGAEINNSSQSISAFTTDGFTTGTANPANESASTTKGFISWNWKAGTGQGSSNTDGSINTTYTSVNTTAGFSISKYVGNYTAGATVGHGLGVAPKLILIKNLTTAGRYWYVYHESLGNNTELYLNDSGTAPGSTGAWETTSPTNQVFTLGDHNGVNQNGNDHIAYCFAEKKGFSKFGSYTGNGNSSGNGPFVYTGFKPAWVIYKNKNAVYHWGMYDNKREPFNVCEDLLYPNLANAESNNDGRKIDMLSNGFKVRVTSDTNDINGSGNTIIYWAFAENPLVGTNKVPATAR